MTPSCTFLLSHTLTVLLLLQAGAEPRQMSSTAGWDTGQEALFDSLSHSADPISPIPVVFEVGSGAGQVYPPCSSTFYEPNTIETLPRPKSLRGFTVNRSPLGDSSPCASEPCFGDSRPGDFNMGNGTINYNHVSDIDRVNSLQHYQLRGNSNKSDNTSFLSFQFIIKHKLDENSYEYHYSF